jgi:hypothetical protein
MSPMLLEPAPVVISNVAKETTAPTPKGSDNHSLWMWCAVACALLFVSGGIRFWRDQAFNSITRESEESPFPLKELPSRIGNWRVIEGSESQLDPQTARVAGSSDHVIRQYVHDKSGEVVSILVLYGIAGKVFAHTPIACYPSAGYTAVPSSHADREMKVAGLANPVRFSSAYYAKQMAGTAQYSHILWSFRNDGVWQPDMLSRWKLFRTHPGMYKVQIHRPVVSIVSEHGPSEALLRDIVSEIERRLAASQAVAASSPAPRQALPK